MRDFEDSVLENEYKIPVKQHSENLLKFCDELHQVLGAARLFEANEMAELCEKSETIFRSLKSKKAETLNKDLGEKVSAAFTQLKALLEMSKHAGNGFHAKYLSEGKTGELSKYYFDSLLI